MALDQYYLLGTFRPAGQPAGAGHHELRHRRLPRRVRQDRGRGRADLPRATWTPAATSSTPPTSTPPGRARRILGRLIAEAGIRDRLVLTRQVHQQRRPGRPERRRQRPQAHDPGRRGVAAPAAAPTTSTSTCCTRGTGSPRSRRSLRTFDDLVRAGKIRYAGLSDVPAWYAAPRADAAPRRTRLSPMVNLQLPYSLVERDIEAEHVPMAQTLGLGITAWSPLGGGFLTGKYRSSDRGPDRRRAPQQPGRGRDAVGRTASGNCSRRWRPWPTSWA